MNSLGTFNSFEEEGDRERGLYLALKCGNYSLQDMNSSQSTSINGQNVSIFEIESPACEMFEKLFHAAVSLKGRMTEEASGIIYLVEAETNSLIDQGNHSLIVTKNSMEGWVEDESSPLNNWLVRQFETGDGETRLIALRPPR